MKTIPYSRQEIDEEDIAAVTAVLRSDFLTQGPAIKTFELALTRYCGAAHAVAVSSCTAGLHLICLALGLGKGDRVWTSPISFVASANCAFYTGAQVDFVDIDPVTGNMDPDRLEEKLASAQRKKRLPKLIIPVHFSGSSCDMVRISALAQRYGIKVVEDAAHALGAFCKGVPVGACTHSDATLFSFHAIKSITTGEGGAVLVKDPTLAKKLMILRTHGITRDAECMESSSPEKWYYEMQELGYNYRLTDIQAALGISQMKKLDDFIHRRRTLAQRYRQLLAALPLTLPPTDEESAWHLYPVQLTEEASITRSALFDKLRTRGIGVNVHYIPVHLHPYYRRLGFKPGNFPMAEAFYARILSLPLFPSLSEAEQKSVVYRLEELL